MTRRSRNKASFLVSLFVAAILAVPLSFAAEPDQKPQPHPALERPPAGAMIPQGKMLPDLKVVDVRFVVVKDSTWGNNHPCKIYNLIPTVANVGNQAAGAFEVTIERNKGAGGAFEIACLTCTYTVPGLAKGESMVLAPRQFNNCSTNNWNTFRVTADPKNVVPESEENNNRMTKSF